MRRKPKSAITLFSIAPKFTNEMIHNNGISFAGLSKRQLKLEEQKGGQHQPRLSCIIRFRYSVFFCDIYTLHTNTLIRSATNVYVFRERYV